MQRLSVLDLLTAKGKFDLLLGVNWRMVVLTEFGAHMSGPVAATEMVTGTKT